MDLIEFLAGAAVISLSGVMAPGPMTAATVGKGTRNPHAGALMALGHGIVEFPLMAALAFGAGFAATFSAVKPAVGIAGGVMLLVMGIGMLVKKNDDGGAKPVSRTPVAAGIILSAGNPYFLLWWVTAGSTMILRSLPFGLAGIAALMAVHWLCDFCWLYLLSALSFKGAGFFGSRFERGLAVLCGVLLVFFSVYFICDSAMGLLRR